MGDPRNMNAPPILPPASSLIFPNRNSHAQSVPPPPLVALPPLTRYPYSMAPQDHSLPPLGKLVFDSQSGARPSPGSVAYSYPPAASEPVLKQSPPSSPPKPHRKRTSSSTPSHPRKKRECPICHNYFSNLTTHRATHIQDSRPFTCQTCSRSFKRLNDLMRHEKCHLSKLGEWEFRCPFFINDPAGRSENCHHSGQFTRCDTYKNHLKAIHFKYPPNTPKSDRSKVSGSCRECGMYFNNVQEWLTTHVETKECTRKLDTGGRKKFMT
ncbi:hypothetical protein OGAPHI_005510 [Ogataea philodendri]|uniref:pH-response transcription factor pacC/RIM101 n=1 Tax=Ogataea philodendri TaxID=1378263 RepID=A0A9P8NZV3_9ASCO|nr:uncharacterized protein OGAPHI_005510 [Ogataea philodendri]KAH3662262.1 hypothetical protein OGAPHI_005510 [Ogataea philodendri]